MEEEGGGSVEVWVTFVPVLVYVWVGGQECVCGLHFFSPVFGSIFYLLTAPQKHGYYFC